LKKIRQRNLFFAAAAGLGILVSILVFVSGLLAPEIQTGTILAITLAASGCSAGLWLGEYKKLKMAHLIVGNQILHIRPAVISAGDAEEPEDAGSIEVFVSYFGILLDSKIIKFTYDGIRLKAVEFGRDFISLTYGTDKRVQNIRLLCEVVDRNELEEIVEKFRYETGIVPVIINQ